MQDFWVLLRMDSISWRKTLEISHKLIQWLVVNTRYQEKKQHHNREGWIQGNTKIGPVLEVATSYLHDKHGVEVRIMSFSRDNTLGSEFFMGQISLRWIWTDNETEIPEDQLEQYASKLSAKDSACRSKEKAKPQRRDPCSSSPRIVPIERRDWIDIE